ncbi:MAG: divergent polysaccharide deacetylase family protein [Candidatus Omnitrophica bacterium]|nr:divergent polysaccharide deacetylase family protein [Candidatus Omnitrophota bacterium]
MKSVSPRNGFKGGPFIIIGVWILFAVICIQGYFLCFKKDGGLWKVKRPSQGTSRKIPIKPLKPKGKPVVTQAYMAIVLDDWGYNRTHCKYLEAIKVPLGIAILPELPFSTEVIACAKASGKEPMIHLPMEPHKPDATYPAGYHLTTEMSVPELKKLLDKRFQEMPGIVGVNNHTGSKATESPIVMKVVLNEIKRRGLFFIDSVTSEQSVGMDVAKSLNMKIAKRNVFLDNRNERGAIEWQFASAVRMARKRGFALVIGHDRELTLKIIKEQTDKLRQEGIEFLPVKEYIKRYEYSGN